MTTLSVQIFKNFKKSLSFNLLCHTLLLSFLKAYRGVEQWLARWAHNPKAGGSNPSPANFLGGIAQLVRATES
jgi:hypothetical protein